MKDLKIEDRPFELIKYSDKELVMMSGVFGMTTSEIIRAKVSGELPDRVDEQIAEHTRWFVESGNKPMEKPETDLFGWVDLSEVDKASKGIIKYRDKVKTNEPVDAGDMAKFADDLRVFSNFAGYRAIDSSHEAFEYCYLFEHLAAPILERPDTALAKIQSTLRLSLFDFSYVLSGRFLNDKMADWGHTDTIDLIGKMNLMFGCVESVPGELGDQMDRFLVELRERKTCPDRLPTGLDKLLFRTIDGFRESLSKKVVGVNLGKNDLIDHD